MPAFPSPLNLPITDTDGDSVSDVLDDCPTIVGLVTNHGCPLKSNQNLAWILDSCTIHFAFGKHALDAEAYPYLDRLANIMQEDSTLHLKIDGHTDNKGRSTFNDRLSQKRAAACRDYLVGKGVEKNRIYTEGKGEKKPVADNKTSAGRAQNRRVEIEVVGTRAAK